MRKEQESMREVSVTCLVAAVCAARDVQREWPSKAPESLGWYIMDLQSELASVLTEGVDGE